MRHIAAICLSLALALATACAAADEAPVWPVDMQGLEFLFADSSKANIIRHPDGKLKRICEVSLRGTAFFARHRTWGFHRQADGGMDETSTPPGALDANFDIPGPLIAACMASNALTIEMTITPFRNRTTTADGDPIPGTLMSLGEDDFPNARLEQIGDRFDLLLTTNASDEAPQRIELFSLDDSRPLGSTMHLVVSVGDGTATAYLDGEPVGEAQTVTGDFSNWVEGELAFGATTSGEVAGMSEGGAGGWGGRMEGVAVYARALSAAEAQADYQAYAERISSREPTSAWQIPLKLAARIDVPEPEMLVDYPRCIVFFEYEALADGPEGSGVGKGDHILVAHYGVLGNLKIPFVDQMPVGHEIPTAWLDPWSIHEEVHGEQSFGGDEIDQLDYPRFYYLNDGPAPVRVPDRLGQ